MQIKNGYDALYQKSNFLKKRFLDIFTRIGYGHLTTAFSETEILLSLLEYVMDYRPGEVDSDRFVLSKGHGGGMLFPIFEDMGLFTKMEIDEMVKVGGDFTKLKDMFYPTFEFYGGSLGIGLGMAAGLALGAKMNRESWMTFCLMGDAECYEGSVWEAMLFAGHNQLNNLVVVIDRNYMGCSDFTENMCKLEPFEAKWNSCNWRTKHVNGHSYEELLEAFEGIRSRKDQKPLCIIADTVKGNGIGYLCDSPLMHGYMPKGDEVRRVYEALNGS